LNGVLESGNAIAAAIRELGGKLKSGLEEARLRHQQGLPVPDEILGAEQALVEPTTAKDPTAAVTVFLAVQDKWKALHRGLEALRAFLDANRHQDFEASRKLDELVQTHPILNSHSNAGELAQARKDMAAIIAAKAIIARWPDYRDAFERAFASYRDAYVKAYAKVRAETEATFAAIKGGAAYLDAPADKRDEVVGEVFGEGRGVITRRSSSRPQAAYWKPPADIASRRWSKRWSRCPATGRRSRPGFWS
jgi:hypothetical protein